MSIPTRDRTIIILQEISPSAHMPVGIFSLHKNWLAERTRVWVGNKEIDEQEGILDPMYEKMKARTGGGTGRHLWPRPVQKIAEGKNLLRVELESKNDFEKKVCTEWHWCFAVVSHLKIWWYFYCRRSAKKKQKPFS